MPDLTLEDIKTELDRQAAEREARDQQILDTLRGAKPLTQADAAETMRRGYEQEDERRAREAAQGGEAA